MSSPFENTSHCEQEKEPNEESNENDGIYINESRITFEEAIEIDFIKLGNRVRREEMSTDMTQSLCASVIGDESVTVNRDLSIYDKRCISEQSEGNSSDEEGYNLEEPETEVENSEENSDLEDFSAPYEQLGSTEMTRQNLEDDNDAESDTEFGEFESCPIIYEAEEETKENEGFSPMPAYQPDCKEDLEDTTQDVLGSVNPRTPAKVIPPLDEDKIATIKKAMSGLNLKPPAGADAVLKAKPRIGDELVNKSPKSK